MNSGEENHLLNCFICFQKVRRAKMCPYCSKIGCYQCLKMWFENSKMECPYCRQHVTFNNYADCGRFVDQLKERFSSAEQKSKTKDICPVHQIQMRYYCETCKSPFCPDCSTFEDVHKGHKITLLGKIHQTQKDRIHQQLNRFDEKTKQYKKNGVVMQAKFQELTEQKKIKKLFLENYLTDILKKFDDQFKQKQNNIISQLETNEEEKQMFQELSQSISNNTNIYSQNEVVAKSDEIIQIISSFSSKTTDHIENDTNFLTMNQIIPQFTSFTYELTAFSSLEYSIVYSGGYLLNGIEWRLKVYPKGNGPAKDRCISVFLEMTQAYQSKKEYEYKIELVNQINDTGSLMREYMSQFDIGECWGYNQFIDLDLLNSGFLVDDKLIFKFYVRPSDYKSQTIDQQNYIKRLEIQVKQMERKIKQKAQPIKLSLLDSKFNSLINDLSNKRTETKSQLSVNNQVQVLLNQIQKEEVEEARIQSEEIPEWDD